MKEKESANREEMQPVDEALLENVSGGASLPVEEEEEDGNGFALDTGGRM